VGVSPSSVSLRTVNHFILLANVRCLILHVICGSETVSSETCCRCRGLEKPSQEGPQRAMVARTAARDGFAPRCNQPTATAAQQCRLCAPSWVYGWEEAAGARQRHAQSKGFVSCCLSIEHPYRFSVTVPGTGNFGPLLSEAVDPLLTVTVY